MWDPVASTTPAGLAGRGRRSAPGSVTTRPRHQLIEITSQMEGLFVCAPAEFLSTLIAPSQKIKRLPHFLFVASLESQRGNHSGKISR
jgi:hypothetical protein